MSSFYDVIIIGAGAAGMMCAAQAGKRGKRVWLIDHAPKIGEKIRISGGGRCNFTNIHTAPENFLSQNQHFCKSALQQYTQHDFIALVDKYGIAHHEKTLGQYFCNEKSQQIIDMLLQECDRANVEIQTKITVENVEYKNGLYHVQTDHGQHDCSALVIATGGLSIPKIGATKFGYEIAKKFNIPLVKTQPALVPLTFQADFLDRCKALAGISVEAEVTYNNTTFKEGLLFTHRGLSGPSILQISSYWEEGQPIIVNLTPETDILQFLKEQKKSSPKKDIQTILSAVLPHRLACDICTTEQTNGKIAEISEKSLRQLQTRIQQWKVKPAGTEGYRTAEVTLGGVDTNALSSKTMEAKSQSGLYFIGEVVDVTGHLGGFNFQWAWSSGYVAGQNV